MSDLTMFVDYDNVQPSHTRAGPVSLARMLVALVPTEVLARYKTVTVRLYGGWRSKANLTRLAQRLIPQIRAGSPGVVTTQHAGCTLNLRLMVELADKPIGASLPLEGTLVEDRGLRKFSARSLPWSECANVGRCGFSDYSYLTHSSACEESGCSMKLGDLLVRNEQKMVDTLIVADIAQHVHVAKASDLIVVSSDTDMWPGVLLALRAGCAVIHIHTMHGWRTQGHLLKTIANQLDRIYKQISV